MLYRLLKIWVRAASFLFCRTIRLNDPDVLKRRGPLLLAANHPNSFLDAVLMDILFRSPVHSLARGDAFHRPFVARLLKRLNMLPVYRTREGAGYLSENYQTFEACRSIFRKQGLVLIFSEGLGENEWTLRPLKKGTARLAFSAWEEGIPLEVIPVTITYSSFTRFGKNVFIHFGQPIRRGDFNGTDGHGKRHAAFNAELERQLRATLPEIRKDDREAQRRLLQIPVSGPLKRWLFLPAMAGWLLHAPLYYPVHFFSGHATRGTIHYDSVTIGLLSLLYPFYLLALCLLAVGFTGSHLAWGLVVAAPFTARSLVWISRQTD